MGKKKLGKREREALKAAQPGDATEHVEAKAVEKAKETREAKEEKKEKIEEKKELKIEGVKKEAKKEVKKEAKKEEKAEKREERELKETVKEKEIAKEKKEKKEKKRKEKKETSADDETAAATPHLVTGDPSHHVVEYKEEQQKKKLDHRAAKRAALAAALAEADAMAAKAAQAQDSEKPKATQAAGRDGEKPKAAKKGAEKRSTGAPVSTEGAEGTPKAKKAKPAKKRGASAPTSVEGAEDAEDAEADGTPQTKKAKPAKKRAASAPAEGAEGAEGAADDTPQAKKAKPTKKPVAPGDTPAVRSALWCMVCEESFTNAAAMRRHRLDDADHLRRVRSAKMRGDGPKRNEGKTIFVGQLPYNCEAPELAAHLAKAAPGGLQVRLLTEKETGKSRGMAFVDLNDAMDVPAILALHQSLLKGRRIRLERTLPGKAQSTVRVREIERFNKKLDGKRVDAVKELVERISQEHDTFNREHVNAYVMDFLCTVPLSVAEAALTEYASTDLKGVRKPSAYLSNMIKRHHNGGKLPCFICSSLEHRKADCPQREEEAAKRRSAGGGRGASGR
jgi:hypothetical protein